MKTPSSGTLFERRFEILDELGRGGFGVVLRARDVETGRAVAIKYLLPNPDGYPARVAARFQHEAEALATLHHPNIVELIDAGQTDDGLLYIAMELVEGGDLTAAMVNRPFTANEVARVLRQLLGALAETHGKGILHRDIKPSNILLVDDTATQVKLVDFGIAKLREPIDGRPGLTATGHVVGTPTYMAPELLLGDAAGPSSDLYSLGLVAIQLLAGTRAGREWHQRATAQSVSENSPEQRLPEDVGSPVLRRVLERMTHGDPAQRASSAAQLLQMLDEYRTPRPPAPRLVEVPRERRHVPMVVGAAVLGLVLTVIAGVALTGDSSDPPPPAPRRSIDALLQAPSSGSAASETVAAEPPVGDVGAHARLPSPGCGESAPFSRLGEVRGSFVDPTGWRTLIPADYDPNHAHPVLLVFHADLFSGDMMIEHLRLEQLSDEQKVVVIAPDFPTYPKASRRAKSARFPEALQAAGKRLCLDPRRIYVLGYGVGSDGAERLAHEPWVTALATGGYFPPYDDIPELSRPIPHLFLAMTESAVYPAEGGMSCAFLNSTQRISLEEHEQRLRADNECEGEPEKIYDAGGEVCWEWKCASRFVSCHLAGGLYWPGSGIQEWPIKNVHGCRSDPTISEFDGTAFAWEFFASAPPNPDDVDPPW